MTCYRVIGKLQSVEASEGLNGPGFLMTIECAPPGRLGRLPIFCLASRLSGTPVVGKLVLCHMWLKARATDSLFWGNPLLDLLG